MKVLLLLTILFNGRSWAKETCLVFIGDGSFFKPQIEQRFLSAVQNIKARWPSCEETLTLISLGKSSYIYDEATNRYTPLPAELNATEASRTNLLATLARLSEKLKGGDTLKIYFGDHGTTQGTSSSDGVITPADLNGALKSIHAQGVAVRAVFDHCLSGQMNSALYDLTQKIFLGCGVSSGQDTLTIPGPELTDKTRKNYLAMTAQDSQEFVGTSANHNFHTSTSDRLLFDYHQKHQLSMDECCQPTLSGDPQAATDLVPLAVHEIAAELQSLAASETRAKTNAQRRPSGNIFISADPRGFDFIFQKHQEIIRHAREFFLKQKDPALARDLAEKEALHEKLVECRQGKALLDSLQCPDYDRYVQLTRKLDKEENKFMYSTSVREVPALRHMRQYLGDSLVGLERSIFQIVQATHQVDVYQQKMRFFEIKRQALQHMSKTGDFATWELFKKLKECEQTTRI